MMKRGLAVEKVRRGNFEKPSGTQHVRTGVSLTKNNQQRKSSKRDGPKDEGSLRLKSLEKLCRTTVPVEDTKNTKQLIMDRLARKFGRTFRAVDINLVPRRAPSPNDRKDDSRLAPSKGSLGSCVFKENLTRDNTTKDIPMTKRNRGSKAKKEEEPSILDTLEAKLQRLEQQFSRFTNDFRKGKSNSLDLTSFPLLDNEGKEEIEVKSAKTASALNEFITSVPQNHKNSMDIIVTAREQTSQPSFLELATNPRAFAERFGDDSEFIAEEFLGHLQLIGDGLGFGSDCRPIDAGEFATKRVRLPPQLPKRRKTFIFDLDETLVHCLHSLDEPSDVIVEIALPSGELARVPFHSLNLFLNICRLASIFVHMLWTSLELSPLSSK
eukprot:TRINITY_DN426_c0_g1_i4.p1 TRINITY_DN426_c0_g1~~TRINITY_DN426_c0_g1_i4.p1  ORF type:complete len:382 (+),score=62.58 TRINITY_DN426_c0_g1_i4:35-1180(+)